MKLYIDTTQDANGNAIPGATVTVKNYPGGSLASIYSDNGLTLIGSSIVTSDSTGAFSFFVADGDFILEFRVNGTLVKTQSPVSIFDGGAQITYADTGSLNAYATSNSALEKALRTGLRSWVRIATANTSASTYAYNGLAAKPIVTSSGNALVGGELVIGTIMGVEYDGTSWRLPIGTSAVATGSTIIYRNSTATVANGVATTVFVDIPFPVSTTIPVNAAWRVRTVALCTAPPVAGNGWYLYPVICGNAIAGTTFPQSAPSPNGNPNTFVTMEALIQNNGSGNYPTTVNHWHDANPAAPSAAFITNRTTTGAPGFSATDFQVVAANTAAGGNITHFLTIIELLQ